MSVGACGQKGASAQQHDQQSTQQCSADDDGLKHEAGRERQSRRRAEWSEQRYQSGLSNTDSTLADWHHRRNL